MTQLTKTIRQIVEADYANKGYISTRLNFDRLSDIEKDMLLNAAMNDYAKQAIDLRYELLVESPNFQRVVELVHAAAKNPSEQDFAELGRQLYQSTLFAIEGSVDKELAEQKEVLEQMISHHQKTLAGIRANNRSFK